MLPCIILMSNVALYLQKTTLMKITTSLSLLVTRKIIPKNVGDTDII